RLRKLGSFHRVVIYKDLSAACVIASPTIAVPQLVAQNDCWIASFGFESLVAEHVDMTAPFFILIEMGTRIARPTGLDFKDFFFRAVLGCRSLIGRSRSLTHPCKTRHIDQAEEWSSNVFCLFPGRRRRLLWPARSKPQRRIS